MQQSIYPGVTLPNFLLLLCCATSLWIAPKIFAEPLDEITRGQYLTTILGCGGCHTEGALLGQQSGPWLAGSKIGIAYSENTDGEPNAVIFPSNLTSDRKTGIGGRTKNDIIDLLTSGKKHSGELANSVMPWPNYSLLKPNDITAIAAYIKSLPAINNIIPDHIQPGEKISEPYIRFGVYLFVPDEKQAGQKPRQSRPNEALDETCERVFC